MAKIVILEAFYGGSHKQLLDTILKDVEAVKYDLFTLPAQKWHWKARLSALYFSQNIPTNHRYEILFTTSVLNLAELIGTRSDLAKCQKIVYFHENQLIYPVRETRDRDCQYGLNEIMTCLAADRIVFNSNFNKTSFLTEINRFLNIQSICKFKNLPEIVAPKCEVLYFPIRFDRQPKSLDHPTNERNVLHLIWSHRWEHDKNPNLLAETLFELHDRDVPFKISIIGEQFKEYPKCFDEMQTKLSKQIIHFGYLSREDYIRCLDDGDIVISTADHEFYGVSMLEAVHAGCIPIAPNKLVYPELYPREYLYNTPAQLVKILRNWCRNPSVFYKTREKFFANFDLQPYSIDVLVPKYKKMLGIEIDSIDPGSVLKNQ